MESNFTYVVVWIIQIVRKSHYLFINILQRKSYGIIRVNRTNARLDRSRIYNGLLFGDNNFRSGAYRKIKENAKIDSPGLLQVTRVVQGITSPLIVPRTYYTLLLRFLSCISGEIIMVSFERATNLITSPNHGRKARLSSVLWVRNAGMRLWTSFLGNEIFQFLFSLRAPFFNHFVRWKDWKEVKPYDG